MHLDTEFFKLPLRFDADRLAAEVGQFDESTWRRHPQDFKGNTAIPLVSAHGGWNDDMQGPMQATASLDQCPYIKQILASFDTLIGRARLMRIEPAEKVGLHRDTHYYWFNRVRTHIPVITDPAVEFFCNDKSVHMAAGETWTFDNWLPHKVLNPSSKQRIHLVFDTCGSAAFWELLQQAEIPGKHSKHAITPSFIPYNEQASQAFTTERHNLPVVIDPSELEELTRFLVKQLLPSEPSTTAALFCNLIKSLCHDWRMTFFQYGTERDGWPSFRRLLKKHQQALGNIRIPDDDKNLYLARQTLLKWLHIALNPEQAPAIQTKTKTTNHKRILDAPVFIVAAPRSGSSLLFETLSQAPGIWTIGGEAHREFELPVRLQPANRSDFSNRLLAVDARPDDVRTIRAAMARQVQDRDGARFLLTDKNKQETVDHFLEKTPKNSLRIPFLCEAFPGARFIFLHREARSNIASIIDAWNSGRFVTYPHLPGWSGPPWSLLLPPGWQELDGQPVATVAAWQWARANETILNDLAGQPVNDWQTIRYEDLLQDPVKEIAALCNFIGAKIDSRFKEYLEATLPLSRFTLAPPNPDKWRKHAEEIEPQLPSITNVIQRLGAL